MDSKKTQILLDKYFEGQTTLAEEKSLKAYFKQEEVPVEFKEYQPLFDFINEETLPQLDSQFDEQLLKQLEATPVLQSVGVAQSAKIRRLRIPPMLVRIAAVICLMFGAWWFYESPMSVPKAEAAIDWSKYEVTDVEEAKKIMKMALLRTSTELNKGANAAVQEVQNLEALGKVVN